MTAALKTSLAHWPELSHAVFVAHTEAEYERLVAMLDELVDEVGNDDSHPLASLMEVIGLLIEKYEDEHVPELESSSMLRGDPPAL
jgi:HTH-type transcriptional regulator/antitoxin HigA